MMVVNLKYPSESYIYIDFRCLTIGWKNENYNKMITSTFWQTIDGSKYRIGSMQPRNNLLPLDIYRIIMTQFYSVFSV